jgi:uncharacterized membrane protein YbaN (DUF454 family)
MAISPLKKWMLIALGSLSLGLGVLGIFLPLLPTTVFLLIAAACYARSSERLYDWLLNHKLFGSYIRNWREHKAIPQRSKTIILLLLWATLLISGLFATSLLIVRFGLLVVGAGVTILITKLKTLTPDMVTEP